MSSAQKVGWVTELREQFGLRSALDALELPKSTWYYHQNHKRSYAQKYAHLRPLLEQVARQHPAYGYRRTTVELHEQFGVSVSPEVVRRLHQLWDLRLLRRVQPPPPSGIRQAIMVAGERANLVASLDQIDLFEVVYTDFTELTFAQGQAKAFLMPILAHTCKLVYGWAVGWHADRSLALRAWHRARERLDEMAIAYQGMIMHHDQDAVYTSHAWAHQVLVTDQLRLSFALAGARDNPEMESFFSRFKAENHSLLWEAEDLSALRQVVAARMAYYNEERRHSSLDYLAPLTYLHRRRARDAQQALDCGKHG